MITPSADRIRSQVRGRWPEAEIQVYNRRYIAGTTTWSQHAWGNALDIFAPMPMLDEIADFLRGRKRAGILPVGLILWRVANHFDHIHVEGEPKQTGTPPGGADEEDEMFADYVKGLQAQLNELGFRDQDGNLLAEDGVYGPKTGHADWSQRLAGTGVHSHNVTVTIEPSE